jgi:hypothetical protein
VVQHSDALNRRRIARSLVTVLGLSLIQTIVPPVIVPKVLSSKAEAVDISYASFPGKVTVTTPNGIAVSEFPLMITA